MAQLTNLTYNAFRNIAEKADEMSLLNFAISLSSTKSEFSPAKNLRKTVEDIEVNIHDTSCVITVRFSEKKRLFWKISSTEDLTAEGRYDEFEFHNMTMKNRRHLTKDAYVIYSQCQNDIIICQKIVELMFRIYNPSKFLFYVARKTCNITNILKFNGFNQVDDLTFIVYYPITDQEFNFFWRTIHPKKSLCFNSWDYENTNRENQITFDHGSLRVPHLKWITVEEFFKINSRKIRLGGAETITSDLINRYIKEWINGAHSQLEILEIDIKDGDLNVILDGTESKNMEEVKKERNLENKNLEFLLEGYYYSDDEFNASTGRHVTRNDGKVATINLTESSKVYFVVWNEKFPKITDK